MDIIHKTTSGKVLGYFSVHITSPYMYSSTMIQAFSDMYELKVDHVDSEIAAFSVAVRNDTKQ